MQKAHPNFKEGYTRACFVVINGDRTNRGEAVQ
jgi:hypothetical protein